MGIPPGLSRYNSRLRWLRPLVASTFVLLIFSATFIIRWAFAYVLEGPRWPLRSTVTFQSALGPAGRTLSDGNTSWYAATLPAFPAWNQYIDQVQLASVNNVSAPVSSGDGVNTITFSSTMFGQSFGSNTLAVTFYRASGGTMVEADILFNNHQSWDSYGGPLRSATDIRRVLTHELGHALGLDHPDQHGQRVSAIMNSVVGNIELPTADDIAGVQSLYGARTSSPTPTPTPTATPARSTTSLSANPASIIAGGSSTFTIAASSASNVARNIAYSMSGTAIYGRNYTLSGMFGQATLAAGSTSTTVTLNSIPNRIRQRRRSSKFAAMTLTSGSGYQLSSSNSASVTIVSQGRRPRRAREKSEKLPDSFLPEEQAVADQISF